MFKQRRQNIVVNAEALAHRQAQSAEKKVAEPIKRVYLKTRVVREAEDNRALYLRQSTRMKMNFCNLMMMVTYVKKFINVLRQRLRRRSIMDKLGLNQENWVVIQDLREVGSALAPPAKRFDLFQGSIQTSVYTSRDSLLRQYQDINENFYQKHRRLSGKYVPKLTRFVHFLLRLLYFKRCLRHAVSGVWGLEGCFGKKRPILRFTKVIDGRSYLWKVRADQRHPGVLWVICGDFRHRLQLNLARKHPEMVEGGEFETVWPLYLLALDEFMDRRNWLFYYNDEENQVRKQDLYRELGFLHLTSSIVRDNHVTEVDLQSIGRVKDRLDRVIRFFFQVERKLNGRQFRISEKELFSEIEVLSLRRLEAELRRERCTRATWDGARQDARRTALRPALLFRLTDIWFKQPVVYQYIKKSSNGTYNLITVRLSFKQKSEQLAAEGLDARLHLREAFFELFVGGYRIGDQEIQMMPLEVPVARFANFIPPALFRAEVYHYLLHRQLSRRFLARLDAVLRTQLMFLVLVDYRNKSKYQTLFFEQRDFQNFQSAGGAAKDLVEDPKILRLFRQPRRARTQRYRDLFEEEFEGLYEVWNREVASDDEDDDPSGGAGGGALKPGEEGGEREPADGAGQGAGE